MSKLIPDDMGHHVERWLDRRRLYGRLADRIARSGPCEDTLVEMVGVRNPAVRTRRG